MKVFVSPAGALVLNQVLRAKHVDGKSVEFSFNTIVPRLGKGQAADERQYVNPPRRQPDMQAFAGCRKIFCRNA